MSLEPRVYYDLGSVLRVGPLGCWDLGDEFGYRERQWVVTEVQGDGMAQCLAAGEEAHGSPLATVLRALDGSDGSQSAYMAAKIRAERKRHGLPAVETAVAA